MVNEFNYRAETFDICVDGTTYPVNTSKLFLIQKMENICENVSKEEKPDIIGFMDNIYDCLKKILGEDVFNSIFKEKEYDIVFMAEFCNYLSEISAPQVKTVVTRLSKASQKYNTENLNEPADTQTAENG